MPSLDQNSDDLQAEEVQNGLNRHINGADKDFLDNTESHADSKAALVNGGSKPEPEAAAHSDDVVDEQKMRIDMPKRKFEKDFVTNESITSIMKQNSGSGMISDAFNTDPMLASALLSPMLELDLEHAFANAAPSAALPVKVDQAANDWEVFKRGGPPYPVSFDKLVMNHHHKNSNSWQLAHDLGAASGVYAPTLARYFRHIHVSDPETSGLKTSRAALSMWSAETPKKRGRFTFSVSRPEESHESFADSSVDLAIFAESAHFTDAEATVRSVAQSLAPNGTLAIVTHRPITNVVGNEKVNAAVQRLFNAWGRRPWTVACGTGGRGQQQFSLGLDFVPLPTDLFVQEKTRRILINTHEQGREAFRVPGLDDDTFSFADEGMDSTVSRADEKERRVTYSENDEHGRGWRQQVGWESFRSRVAMLEKGNKAVMAKLEPHFKEIQTVIEETSPNGVHVVVEWAVAVVLATRRP